jgi:ribonuclease HII
MQTIDRVNILQATFLAMKSAVSQLLKKLPREAGEQCILLLDGNQLLPSCSYAQEAVIGGDGIVKSIAAASIVAKVTRDRMIEAYDMEYPGYGFAQHKGWHECIWMRCAA